MGSLFKTRYAWLGMVSMTKRVAPRRALEHAAANNTPEICKSTALNKKETTRVCAVNNVARVRENLVSCRNS